MEIQIIQYGKKWGFELVSGNHHVVMQSACCYTHKRNAVAAARSIAGSKLTVVVKE
ncbi:hypothetical protein [Fimbriiglobus ruber]|uniref:DUF1508 domain-containing protein n=1 Tax=Fimbriiglobus ruber TaxID=1908690 RepID=A0A225DL43_9BACT|nr:hypothetical protein [Fimbriiglobus ruber]OWK42161.1 hypothetical protein FRUB_04239 [Fimbriiglobus ruber]